MKKLVLLGALVVVVIVVLAIAILDSKNSNPAPTEPASSPMTETTLASDPSPQDWQMESPPAITLIQEGITELLSSVSADGGAAFNTADSAQNQALNWLLGNANLDSYSDSKLVQRYALATLIYRTVGDKWKDKWGWLYFNWGAHFKYSDLHSQWSECIAAYWRARRAMHIG